MGMIMAVRGPQASLPPTEAYLGSGASAWAKDSLRLNIWLHRILEWNVKKAEVAGVNAQSPRLMSSCSICRTKRMGKT